MNVLIKLLLIMKIILFSQIYLFSQQEVSEKAGLRFGVNYSTPFFLKDEALDFFEKQMNLKKNNSYGYGVSLENRQFELYATTGMEMSKYVLKNEVHRVDLEVLNSFFGIGYFWEIKNRLILGIEKHIVGLVGFQTLSKLNSSDNLYDGFKNDEYNTLILDNRFKINFGTSPNIRFNINERLSLSVRYQYYFFNMSNLGHVNDIQLYRNYSNLSFGLVFNDLRLFRSGNRVSPQGIMPDDRQSGKTNISDF